MSRFAAQEWRPAAPVRPGAILARKCAACGAARSGAKCKSCDEEAGSLQRHARSPGAGRVDEAPPIVHEVLRSSGQRLGDRDRAFFEPRFGHDFSGVRVHTDARAAASAAAVDAEAYTVGQNIVFGSGRYSPATREGRGLIAHELGHTVQQARGAAGAGADGLRIDPPGSPLEREADAMAGAAMSGQKESGGATAGPASGRLQRQGMGDLRIAEGLHESQEQEQAARTREAGPANMSRRILTPADITNAQAAAPGSAPPGRVTPAIWGATFVLHDTASPVGPTSMARSAQRGRRSSGEGAAAWVPGTGSAVIAHQPLFGPRRPAATQYERGQDVMVKATREAEYRAVWQATSTSVREAALDAVLSQQGSPAAEAATERATAIAELGGASGIVHSAGAWAVEDICGQVSSATVQGLAATPQSAPLLEGACQRLAPLLIARRARIGSTVNVEIVQARGSDCRTTGTLTPLTPYTADQYTNVKQVYLRAALEARVFPQITTHFLIDRNIGDHCDPRCFDVTRLYREIQAALLHPVGCTYGIAPSYGTGATNNVWWHDPVCGGGHP